MRFSREIGGDNVQSVIEDGLEAEKFGYDQVWVPDHLVDVQPVFAIFDAWTVLAYLGAKTQDLKLASGVTDVQRIHPAKTANIVSTLASLAAGRAVLGIGAGEIMNTKPYGIQWEDKDIRVRRLKEYIQVVKLLWSSTFEESVSFKGEFYSLDHAHLSLPTKKPHPRIYVGSFSSKSTLRVAGEVADGWYPGSLNTVESFKEKANIAKDAATSAGRSPEELDLVANVPTLVVMNESETKSLREVAKQAIKAQMISNRYIFKVLGISDEKFVQRELEYQHATPGPRFEKTMESVLGSLQLDDEKLEHAVDRVFAFGSRERCLNTIQKFIDAGATQIFFSNIGASKETYSRISKEIIPSLKRV
ncbi:MAG TPA: LLM class flavin-dependent oxidoreductase [Nitrososphaerales archaeon]|nr:LLM class flavin-dependent oxidoreductase [Nitrososphaerales archaeon]